MSDENTKTFSEDYVKELRSENASWRQKYQEAKAGLEGMQKQLEAKEVITNVGAELSKRGIKAEPSWVKVDKNQNVEEAVEKFLKDYPHLAVKPDNDQDTHQSRFVKRPKDVKRDNTNADDKSDTSLKSYKKDPAKRSQLRDTYREMLHMRNNSIY